MKGKKIDADLLYLARWRMFFAPLAGLIIIIIVGAIIYAFYAVPALGFNLP